MARRKKGSRVLDMALRRVSGFAAIDENLDLGHGLTLENYRKAIADVQAKLDAYNEALSSADAAKNDLETAEKNLRDMSERMMNAVAAVYGKDSSEYEMAGGVRKSERKRPKREKRA
jgi:hypothetical protein